MKHKQWKLVSIVCMAFFVIATVLIIFSMTYGMWLSSQFPSSNPAQLIQMEEANLAIQPYLIVFLGISVFAAIISGAKLGQYHYA